MANHSFRVAYLAMCFAVGLSTCLLLSEPEKVRSLLLYEPSDSIAAVETGSPDPVDLPAYSVDETNDDWPPVTIDRPVPDLHSPESPNIAEAPPLPAQTGDVLADSSLVPQIHDASRSSTAQQFPVLIPGASTGESTGPLFDELPPPAEFAAEMPSGDEGSVADRSGNAFVEFADLGRQIEDLRGDLSQLQASQSSVARSLEELATADAERRSPQEVEIQTWVLQVPSRGATASGFIAALMQSETLAPVTPGRSTAKDLRYAWLDAPPAQLLRWMREVTPVREVAMKSLRVTQTSTADLDLMSQMAPRMEQARGRWILERTPEPSAGGILGLRAFSIQPGFIEVEFLTRHSTTNRSDDAWTHVAVPETGTLAITIPIDGADAGSRSSAGEARTGAVAQIESNLGRRELVVILAPRRIAAASDVHSPLPELFLPDFVPQPELDPAGTE